MQGIEEKLQGIEEKLFEISTRISKESGETSESFYSVWKTISSLIDMISDMGKEIVELRNDVDKLIENSCGCKKSA